MRDMEADPTGINQMKDVAFRLFPAVGPMLLISMGYIDPGKWASAVEGGAHFGSDLVLQMLVFNFAAILCQYLAACIGLVTGKNLAQICSEEYNKSICIFLGVQAELSIIALDLTMILGIAHSLNLLFGVDLFTCVFLTALDAVFFPIFATIMEKCKEKVPYISIAGFILLSYILGMLFSQPEIPFGINGMLTRLNGESAFTLMSLLGSAIMPHNFYLHSSIVQQQQLQKPSHASKNALCNDHFFAILCVFSGIFLVNYVLMNSAATVFHNAGAVVLTFQDALLLMDQKYSQTKLTHFFIKNESWKYGRFLLKIGLNKRPRPPSVDSATANCFPISSSSARLQLGRFLHCKVYGPPTAPIPPPLDLKLHILTFAMRLMNHVGGAKCVWHLDTTSGFHSYFKPFS